MLILGLIGLSEGWAVLRLSYKEHNVMKKKDFERNSRIILTTTLDNRTTQL